MANPEFLSCCGSLAITGHRFDCIANPDNKYRVKPEWDGEERRSSPRRVEGLNGSAINRELRYAELLNKCAEALDKTIRKIESLESPANLQIRDFGNWIIQQFEGEPSQSRNAIESAKRILLNQKNLISRLERMNKELSNRLQTAE
jgi:hypothetical protein